MKNLIIVFLMLMAICDWSGCDDKSGSKDWHAGVKEFEQKGWKFQELLGRSDPATFVANADSRTARSVTAVWIEDGVRHEKEFQQTDKLYCLLTFSKKNGDTFQAVLWMEKSQK